MHASRERYSDRDPIHLSCINSLISLKVVEHSMGTKDNKDRQSVECCSSSTTSRQTSSHFPRRLYYATTYTSCLFSYTHGFNHPTHQVFGSHFLNPTCSLLQLSLKTHLLLPPALLAISSSSLRSSSNLFWLVVLLLLQILLILCPILV
jgi:hypothetical protein